MQREGFLIAKFLREEKDLSIQEVASRMGSSGQAVRYLEERATTLVPETIVAFARAIDREPFEVMRAFADEMTAKVLQQEPVIQMQPRKGESARPPVLQFLMDLGYCQANGQMNILRGRSTGAPTVTQVYGQYLDWCEQNFIRPIERPRFQEKLQELNVEIRKVSVLRVMLAAIVKDPNDEAAHPRAEASRRLRVETADQLKQIRDFHMWKVSELAKELEVSTSAVREAERGAKMLCPFYLAKFRKLFGVTGTLSEYIKSLPAKE